MTIEIALSRAKRKGLMRSAGHYFRGPDSALVTALIAEGKEPYLGIQSGTGTYTILGRQKCYLITKEGEEIEISYSALLTAFKKDSWDRGKSDDFEYLRIGDGRTAWVKDAETMTSIWNLAQFLGSK